jgi:hypothetical protein
LHRQRDLAGDAEVPYRGCGCTQSQRTQGRKDFTNNACRRNMLSFASERRLQNSRSTAPKLPGRTKGGTICFAFSASGFRRLGTVSWTGHEFRTVHLRMLVLINIDKCKVPPVLDGAPRCAEPQSSLQGTKQPCKQGKKVMKSSTAKH